METKNKVMAVAAMEFSDKYHKAVQSIRGYSTLNAMLYFALLVEPNNTKAVLDMEDYMLFTKVKKRTALKNIEKLKEINFISETSVFGVYWVNPEMSFTTYVIPPEPTAKQIEIWGEPDREWVEVDEDDLDWTMIEVINKHLIDVQLDLINITN